jgi:hypothetical protein
VTAARFNAATVTAAYDDAVAELTACDNAATVKAAAQFGAAALKDTMRTAAPSTAQTLHCLRILSVVVGHYYHV